MERPPGIDAPYWALPKTVKVGLPNCALKHRPEAGRGLCLPPLTRGVRPIDKQLRILFLQNQKLRAARDLLLARLMSGESQV